MKLAMHKDNCMAFAFCIINRAWVDLLYQYYCHIYIYISMYISKISKLQDHYMSVSLSYKVTTVHRYHMFGYTCGVNSHLLYVCTCMCGLLHLYLRKWIEVDQRQAIT